MNLARLRFYRQLLQPRPASRALTSRNVDVLRSSSASRNDGTPLPTFAHRFACHDDYYATRFSSHHSAGFGCSWVLAKSHPTRFKPIQYAPHGPVAQQHYRALRRGVCCGGHCGHRAGRRGWSQRWRWLLAPSVGLSSCPAGTSSRLPIQYDMSSLSYRMGENISSADQLTSQSALNPACQRFTHDLHPLPGHLPPPLFFFFWLASSSLDIFITFALLSLNFLSTVCFFLASPADCQLLHLRGILSASDHYSSPQMFATASPPHNAP